MILHLHGTVHGNRIELDHDPGLPPGTGVTVQIERSELSIEERRRRIDESCGAWKDDDSLDMIFAEILNNRRQSTPREVDWDAPS